MVYTPRPAKKVISTLGKPTVVQNIKPVKGLIGKKRLEKLDKAIRNRDRRVRYQVKKMAGEYTPENYAKLARSGYLPSQIKVDFSKIKTIKDYNILMRMLEADKTPEWKSLRLHSMRKWISTMVAKNIYVTPDQDPELFNRLADMSEAEILQFRKDNPLLISDFFEWYNADSIESEERSWLWAAIREAVGLPPLDKEDLIYAL